jgi:CheY-like chemotaxis protein
MVFFHTRQLLPPTRLPSATAPRGTQGVVEPKGIPMTPSLILLVDRDPDTRRILRASLEHAGYRVLDAASGEAGLALAREHVPDIVVGDFPMAVAGTARFSEMLRADGRFADTPILSITARGLEADLARARTVAAEVLLKPVGPRTVVRAVARLLKQGSVVSGGG